MRGSDYARQIYQRNKMKYASSSFHSSFEKSPKFLSKRFQGKKAIDTKRGTIPQKNNVAKGLNNPFISKQFPKTVKNISLIDKKSILDELPILLQQQEGIQYMKPDIKRQSLNITKPHCSFIQLDSERKHETKVPVRMLKNHLNYRR